jgi:hypothetical protein
MNVGKQYVVAAAVEGEKKITGGEEGRRASGTHTPRKDVSDTTCKTRGRGGCRRLERTGNIQSEDAGEVHPSALALFLYYLSGCFRYSTVRALSLGPCLWPEGPHVIVSYKTYYINAPRYIRSVFFYSQSFLLFVSPPSGVTRW